MWSDVQHVSNPWLPQVLFLDSMWSQGSCSSDQEKYFKKKKYYSLSLEPIACRRSAKRKVKQNNKSRETNPLFGVNTLTYHPLQKAVKSAIKTKVKNSDHLNCTDRKEFCAIAGYGIWNKSRNLSVHRGKYPVSTYMPSTSESEWKGW